MKFRKEPTCPHSSSSKKKRRRRKSAPVWLRLQRYLSAWARRWGGRWKACPSYAKLAKCLGVCVDTISRAFRFLENSPFCPLAFRSGFTGANGGRQKLFVLKSWLRYDREPLLFRKDGRSRGIRTSFRRTGTVVTPAVTPLPSPPPSPAAAREGNSDLCHPPVIKKRLPSADTRPDPPVKPFPAPAGMSKRALWGMAAAAARRVEFDTELFWPEGRVRMPHRALKALFFAAFSRGVEWSRARGMLRRSIDETLAAAAAGDCGGKVIKNPGAFAFAVFRARLSGRNHAPAPRPWRRAALPATAPPEPALPPLPQCIPAAPCRTAEEVERARSNALSLAAAMREALFSLRKAPAVA